MTGVVLLAAFVVGWLSRGLMDDLEREYEAAYGWVRESAAA